jgi:hypothetical protein
MFYNWFRLISFAVLFPALSISFTYLFFHSTSFFDFLSIFFSSSYGLTFSTKLAICTASVYTITIASSIFIFSGSSPNFLNGYFPGDCELIAEQVFDAVEDIESKSVTSFYSLECLISGWMSLFILINMTPFICIEVVVYKIYLKFLKGRID